MFPVLWLLLFSLFLLRARFHLGHWPSVSNSMAKSLGFSLHYGLSAYALLAVPWIVIGVLVATAVLRHKDSLLRIGLPLAVLAASIALLFAVFAIDLRGFVLWFLD
jgi:hypothetical protein